MENYPLERLGGQVFCPKGSGTLSIERRNLSAIRLSMYEAPSLYRLVYANPQLIEANHALNIGLRPWVYTKETELKQDTLCWNCHRNSSALTGPHEYRIVVVRVHLQL